jgi:hypothetical protein
MSKVRQSSATANRKEERKGTLPVFLSFSMTLGKKQAPVYPRAIKPDLVVPCVIIGYQAGRSGVQRSALPQQARTVCTTWVN